MKYLSFFICGVTLILTACSLGRPSINGGDTDQPIMDGWTMEMAAEYWLASVLGYEHAAVVNDKGQWLTPDSLAHLTKGHVRVDLPIHESNPMPRFDVTYRQPKTGGIISFSNSPSQQPTISGDTLQSIGLIHYHFLDNMYRDTADTTVYVQSHGKGLFTGFRMSHVRKREDDGSWKWVEHGMAQWSPFVISVYPGGDSLVVSRGLKCIETFIADLQ